jgi:hypothetical protein
MPGAAFGLLLALLAFVVELVSGFNAREDIFAVLLLSALLAAALGIGTAVRLEIRMVEQISWRWSWPGFLVGCLLGLPMTLTEQSRPVVWIVEFGFLGGIWGGLRKGERVTRRQRPGAGLVQTLKYACLAGLGFSLTGMVVAFFCFPLTKGPGISESDLSKLNISNWAINGAALGLMLGLFFSGFDAVVKHVILRVQLCVAGCLPIRTVLFLKQAHDCLLLRRVGSGYIFLHRYLLDHFASRCPKDVARAGAPLISN